MLALHLKLVPFAETRTFIRSNIRDRGTAMLYVEATDPESRYLLTFTMEIILARLCTRKNVVP